MESLHRVTMDKGCCSMRGKDDIFKSISEKFSPTWMVLMASLKPGRQVHRCTLFTTMHSVLEPHGLGWQAFTGFTQGMAGGLPSNRGRQKHTGWPPTRRQPALGPHALARQLGPSGMQRTKGLPVLPRGHEQIGLPLSTSQRESVPHGDGTQGLEGGRTVRLQPTSGLPENPGENRDEIGLAILITRDGNVDRIVQN